MDQWDHFYKAHRNMMDGVKAFLEIQSGPNPLTAAEIRKLAEKRPEKWGKFLPYVEKMEAQGREIGSTT